MKRVTSEHQFTQLLSVKLLCIHWICIITNTLFDGPTYMANFNNYTM